MTVRTAIYMTGIENHKLDREDLFYIEEIDRHCRSLILETGLSYPVHFLEKLAKQYPTKTIIYYYADELIGVNCGFGVISEGVINNHPIIEDKDIINCYLVCFGKHPLIKVNKDNEIYIDWESEGELC